MTGKKVDVKRSTTMFVLMAIMIIFTGFSTDGWAKPDTMTFDAYHSPKAVNDWLKGVTKSNSAFARLHKIAVSPGGNTINLIELGPEVGKRKKNRPAILVAANMEGTVPVASEAALYLIQSLVKNPKVRQDLTWYILPVGNPDAAWNYFKKPLRLDSRNKKPHNDDKDDQTDEDGVEDLDGNGIITMMRVKHPEGKWIPVPSEARLMKKADAIKGEKGLYKLYTEGIDNDKDGKYNEDGPGGVNLAINFPHLFKFFTKSGGAWAGSEVETFNLFKFVFERREIAMTIYFGHTNFCMTPPKGGRKGTADFNKIKIPKSIGQRLGFDHTRTYTMAEIIEKAQAVVPPGIELTESMVASFLGLGAAVNPNAKDLKFYNEISEHYKEYLKKHKLDAKRLDPRRARNGSFELWAYYHLGLPSFSLDFWAPPQLKKDKEGPAITPEKLEKMTNKEFIALGEEKIDKFLKAAGAPIKAKMLINMVKNGVMTTKKMAGMMKQMPKPKSKEGADPDEKALLAFSDKKLKGKGFIPWKAFKHPSLGDVEIGGFVPYAAHTPPANMLEKLLKGQVPWVFELVKKIPAMKLVKTKVKAMGGNVFRITAWVENTGLLPYPTAMGKRNNRPFPVVVAIKGQDVKLLEGKKRQIIKTLDGHETKKVQWLVLAKQPGNITLHVITPNAGSDRKTVALNQGGSR